MPMFREIFETMHDFNFRCTFKKSWKGWTASVDPLYKVYIDLPCNILLDVYARVFLQR